MTSSSSSKHSVLFFVCGVLKKIWGWISASVLAVFCRQVCAADVHNEAFFMDVQGSGIQAGSVAQCLVAFI